MNTPTQATSAQPAAAEHSDAYSQFVSAENDLVGALAYALYKKQKIEYILRIGCNRDDPRVRDYHKDLNPGRITTLRDQADAQIRAFADRVVFDAEESFRKEIAADYIGSNFAEHAQHLADIKSSLAETKTAVVSGTQLWKSVLAGVAASVVFGLVLSAAKIIDWTNPFNEFTQHKTGGNDNKSLPPNAASGP